MEQAGVALILPRSVFLHIPKTGGTWCRTAIRRAGIPHVESGTKAEPLAARIHHELRHVSALAQRRLLFAFVRHPLDWWRSYWCYRQRCGWRKHPVDDVCRSDDFPTFMWNVVERLPAWCSSMYRRFVGPRHHPIHFVGHFESLADHLVEALHLAGERFNERAIRTTPVENAGDYSRWPAHYTPALYEAVFQAEREAIDCFGY